MTHNASCSIPKKTRHGQSYSRWFCRETRGCRHRRRLGMTPLAGMTKTPGDPRCQICDRLGHTAQRYFRRGKHPEQGDFGVAIRRSNGNSRCGGRAVPETGIKWAASSATRREKTCEIGRGPRPIKAWPQTTVRKLDLERWRPWPPWHLSHLKLVPTDTSSSDESGELILNTERMEHSTPSKAGLKKYTPVSDRTYWRAANRGPRLKAARRSNLDHDIFTYITKIGHTFSLGQADHWCSRWNRYKLLRRCVCEDR